MWINLPFFLIYFTPEWEPSLRQERVDLWTRPSVSPWASQILSCIFFFWRYPNKSTSLSKLQVFEETPWVADWKTPNCILSPVASCGHGIQRQKGLCFLFWFPVMVQEDYHSQNPYHNAVHAADVTQAMHCYLREPKVMTAFHADVAFR